MMLFLWRAPFFFPHPQSLLQKKFHAPLVDRRNQCRRRFPTQLSPGPAFCLISPLSSFLPSLCFLIPYFFPKVIVFSYLSGFLPFWNVPLPLDWIFFISIYFFPVTLLFIFGHFPFFDTSPSLFSFPPFLLALFQFRLNLLLLLFTPSRQGDVSHLLDVRQYFFFATPLFWASCFLSHNQFSFLQKVTAAQYQDFKLPATSMRSPLCSPFSPSPRLGNLILHLWIKVTIQPIKFYTT